MSINIKYLKHLILLTKNKIIGKSRLEKVTNGLYHASKDKTPYISQFAEITEEKDIEKIDVDEEVFQMQGYPSKKDFDFWNRRVCGIACVKMILDCLNKSDNKTMWDFIQEGLELDGYKLYDDNGNFVDIGWYHKPLLRLAKNHGVQGYLRQSLTHYNIADEILRGNFVIASVKVPQRSNLEDDGTYFKSDYKGKTYGHLVLITAVKIQNGKPEYFIAHNPTGYEGYEANSKINIDTFERIFNGRAIVLKGN